MISKQISKKKNSKFQKKFQKDKKKFQNRSSIESSSEVVETSTEPTENENEAKKIALSQRRESVLESFEKNQVKTRET